jgi:hypothetical protein
VRDGADLAVATGANADALDRRRAMDAVVYGLRPCQRNLDRPSGQGNRVKELSDKGAEC